MKEPKYFKKVVTPPEDSEILETVFTISLMEGFLTFGACLLVILESSLINIVFGLLMIFAMPFSYSFFYWHERKIRWVEAEE